MSVEMEDGIDEARKRTGHWTATVVYRYGLAAPHEGSEVVRDQMRRAREYRRFLVFVERGRRDAARRALAELAPEVGLAEAAVVGSTVAVQWMVNEISQTRKAARKRAESAAMRLAVGKARAALRDQKATLFALRAKYSAQCAECRKAKSEVVPCPHATPEAHRLRARLDAVDARATSLISDARKNWCGLYWANYLLVERAMQASRGAPLYERDGVTPHDPENPHSLSDAVAVQVQSTRPLTIAGAEAGADTRLRVKPPPWPEAWLAGQSLDPAAPTRPSARTPGQRPDGSPAPATRPDGTPARWVRDRACREGELRMRVGPDGEWAAWRLDQHRPAPPKGQVKWATVVRRQRGPHAEWSLCLTVEAEAAPPPTLTGRVVAVDVGWRTIGDELRVAAWRDSDGGSGELRLSAMDLRAIGCADEVRSLRDGALESAKLRLHRWLSVASEKDCPAWLREEAAHVRQWRSPARLVRLLHRWGVSGGPQTMVGQIAYDDLVAWADGDRHRWAEQESRRAWALRRRRERYRVFAAALADRYDTVVLERFDLRKVAERKLVGQDAAENEVARSNRQRACVSELREAVENACRSRGRAAVAVDATDSTRTCPSCGMVADRGQDERVVLRCECGHEWDQDRDGAALILLHRWRERPGDARVLVGARGAATLSEPKEKSDQKWARARRMSAQKKARNEAAREGG